MVTKSVFLCRTELKQSRKKNRLCFSRDCLPGKSFDTDPGNNHFIFMPHTDTKARLFEKIFFSTKDRVFGFIKKMLRDDATVQDCMQQSYLKLWETLDTIDTTQDVLPLLYTYSRNITIDHLRKNTRFVWMDDLAPFSELLTEECSAQAHLQQKDAIAELEVILNDMPSRRRQVFKLIKLNGFSYREAAQQLDISVSTVEKHMNEAYKMFSRESVLKLWICWMMLKG